MLSRKTWTRRAWSKLAASSDKSAGTDPSRWQFPAVLGVVVVMEIVVVVVVVMEILVVMVLVDLFEF